jgi:uncharacterized protein
LKIENQYIIYFKGLKEGVHCFDFAIEKPFFEAYEQLEVPDGKLKVRVELTKHNSFLELFVDLSGDLLVRCDRCLEYFSMPVEYSGHLMVRFSETEKEPDEEVIFLHPDEDGMDLRHYLYECLSLSIPIRKVHPDLPNGSSGCDPEMMKRLNEISVTS